jgi:hypothetical protein
MFAPVWPINKNKDSCAITLVARFYVWFFLICIQRDRQSQEAPRAILIDR